MKCFLAQVALAAGVALPASGATGSAVRYASTQAQFEEIFLTAGYSTAFGAALGAAALGLTPQPSRHTRLITMGASAGFMVGSLVGAYLVLDSPGGSYETGRRAADSGELLAKGPRIVPLLDERLRLQGVHLEWGIVL